MAMNVSGGLHVELQEASRRQIVSDELYPYINSLLLIITVIFSVPAVLFNAMNVFIFCKIGVTDSITVCFLHLAVCDFFTMIFVSLGGFFILFFVLGVPGSKNMATYTFVTAMAYNIPQDIAAATTTYIALQRGLCVAWPFLARRAFTKKTSVIVLMVITLFLFGCNVPRTVTYRLMYVPDPTTNSSQILIVHFLDLWNNVTKFYFIFVKIFLVNMQYIIMSICAVAIAIGMKSSIKLKSTSSSALSFSSDSKSNHKKASETGKNESIFESPRVSKDGKDSPTVGNEEKDRKVQRKEVKELMVIKQVLIVVLIHIICTTPCIAAVIYEMYETRLQFGGPKLRPVTRTARRWRNERTPIETSTSSLPLQFCPQVCLGSTNQ
ncbi:chemosensory receptor c [Plakobranchus ocellatus]|uniref:Chemosensory receptor c n=1 Tax=Plakobranchus ocellatus TaxID=259542 RepID=A0AAV3ZMC3_9GAST|nr:chemosensory receptor c [Plakobranchus ocellatus]